MGNTWVRGRGLLAALSLAIAPSLCFAATNSTAAKSTAALTSQPDKFFTLPIPSGLNATQKLIYRYGVPFLATSSSASQIKVGAPVKKLFLLGMTETMRPSAWSESARHVPPLLHRRQPRRHPPHLRRRLDPKLPAHPRRERLVRPALLSDSRALPDRCASAQHLRAVEPSLPGGPG